MPFRSPFSLPYLIENAEIEKDRMGGREEREWLLLRADAIASLRLCPRQMLTKMLEGGENYGAYILHT